MIKKLFLEFGRKFLICSADATTGLLIKLCSGDYQSIVSLPLFLPLDQNENTKNNNPNRVENNKEKDKNKCRFTKRRDCPAFEAGVSCPPKA